MPDAGADSAELNYLIAARLMQIHAYAEDMAATPILKRASKEKALHDLVTATAAIPAQTDVPTHLRSVQQLKPGPGLVQAVEEIAISVASHLTDSDIRHALIDAVTSTDWPAGLGWSISRHGALARAAGLLTHGLSTEDIDGLDAAYQSAVTRLRKDSVAPGTQLTFGSLTLAASAASGGLASGVGTLVGTHVLGLSGAAATSAGLAILGGGSLAAGGFGMAGGNLLIHAASHVITTTGRSLAYGLASQSAAAFIGELAKLDLLAQVEPQRLPEVTRGIQTLHRNLLEELADVRPSDVNARRGRLARNIVAIMGNPASTPQKFKQIKNDIPPVAERNLAASLRAVEFEIRHLQAPRWKRHAFRVPRLIGIPAASKILDRY